MVDDPRPVATKVTKELKELRVMCDRHGIPWHDKNKPDSLRAKIDIYTSNSDTGPMPDLGRNTFTVAESATVIIDANTKPADRMAAITVGDTIILDEDGKVITPRHRREIPTEIKEALKYLASTHISRTKLITQFIESLL